MLALVGILANHERRSHKRLQSSLADYDKLLSLKAYQYSQASRQAWAPKPETSSM
jgi:hypothetical protein